MIYALFMNEIAGKNEQSKVLVTPTKASQSRGLWLSLLMLPLGWIPVIKDFIVHNPEAATITVTAWGWFIRLISNSPLLFK